MNDAKVLDLIKYCALMCLVTMVFPSQYLWPTNASHTVTAVFGDVRPRRYHAGLDIRTYGKTGFPIYAIENGYIERVRTSSKSYGRALYLHLDDGNTAVYAHLESFSPELDSLVSKLHRKNQRYALDYSLTPGKYRVRKGDILGHTGDTGSINGPHLHFELRDSNQNPINPLDTNLDIPDRLFPEAQAFEIIPLRPESRVNGLPSSQAFPVERIDQSHYRVADTIRVFGPVGLGAKIVDKIDGQPFDYSIYRITLTVDAQHIYTLSYDHYTWPEDPLVYTERDFQRWRAGEGKFHRLFRLPTQPELSFVSGDSNGYLDLTPGLHSFVINASDIHDHEITLSGTLESPASAPAIQSSALAPASPLPGAHFSAWQEENGLHIRVDFEAATELPSLLRLNGDTIPLFPGLQSDTAEGVLPLSSISDENTAVLIWGTTSTQPGPEFHFSGRRVIPGVAFSLSSDGLTLSGGTQAFYDTAYVQISTADIPENSDPPHAIQIGPVFGTEPGAIPFRKELTLTLELPDTMSETHTGIFYWDTRAEQWTYLRTTATTEGLLSTTVLSAERFALISETVPPEITDLVPVPEATYPTRELRGLSFSVDDAFSGLDGETAVQILLNGEPLIFEYNSYRKSCSYTFDDLLSPGRHTLKIQVNDHLNNTTTLDTNFYIK